RKQFEWHADTDKAIFSGKSVVYTGSMYLEIEHSRSGKAITHRFDLESSENVVKQPEPPKLASGSSERSEDNSLGEMDDLAHDAGHRGRRNNRAVSRQLRD